MAVIALAGNKGGCGKTTLAINLASALSRRASVVVLDADPQGSGMHWMATGDGHGPVQIVDAATDLSATVQHWLDRVDHLLIDCPPAVDAQQTQSALALAGKVLVPVLPSPLDIWASLHVGPAVCLARQDNPNLQAMLVINQLEPRTRLSRLARQALQELDLPTVDTVLRRRVVYRLAMLQGCSVLEMGARGAEAAREIEQLTDELVERT